MFVFACVFVYACLLVFVLVVFVYLYVVSSSDFGVNFNGVEEYIIFLVIFTPL